METNGIQQQFFHHLKANLPAHISLPDELCDLLDISADSAYRRIRGEKQLSFAELKLLCSKYHLSLDHFLNINSDAVMFKAPDLVANYSSFADYLKNIQNGVKFFHQFKQKKIMYLCKDAPLWYFYLFPELAAFKTFFFLRSVRNEQAFFQKKFSMDEFSFHDCFQIGQETLRLYNEIPSEELWNNESLNSTINQISYYREAELFQTPDECNRVIDSLIRTIDHLELQTIAGQKFLPGATDISYRAVNQFYVNDLIIGNNTIYGEVDGEKVSWVTYSVLNILFTRDKKFNDHLFTNFNTLKSRSALISGAGEKERAKFFNSLRNRALALKK
jgi:hypothetical protein